MPAQSLDGLVQRTVVQSHHGEEKRLTIHPGCLGEHADEKITLTIANLHRVTNYYKHYANSQ